MNFERLRELVLERAIRGELVPQNCDEDCVKEGTSENVPFNVPASWGWVQLADLSVKRKTVDPMTLDEPSVELWSIPAYDSGAAQEICPKDIGSSKKIVLEGDVLLSKIVPHIKRAWVVTESGRNLPKLASTEWLVYGSGRLIPEFLALQFRSPYFRKKMLENISGMGSLKRANPSSLAKVFLPVPPLLEQVRIVEKIKEAFAEIDRAEKAYEELQTLAGVLRGQILQEAIQGKLVPQLAEEGVVEQIGVAPDERPFEIPKSWKWRALDEIFKFVDYRGKTPTKTTDGVRLITASNVRQGYVDHKRIEFISSEEYIDRQNRGISKKGDILFTTEAPLGNVALADLDVYSAGQRVITLQTDSENKKLLMYFMLSPYFQKALKNNATGTTAQGIKAARLKKLMLPVPPVEEQARIASKVEELLKQVDALSA